MGQQFNKVIKRRRRLAYIERKKIKGLELAAASKAKPRKAAAPKKVAAPVVAEAAAAVE